MNFDSKKAEEVYIDTLRKMTCEQKLKKACELSDFTKMLFINGLKNRFPGIDENLIRQNLIQRLNEWGSSNF